MVSDDSATQQRVCQLLIKKIVETPHEVESLKEQMSVLTEHGCPVNSENIPTKEVSTKEVSTKEVSTKEVSTKEVSTKDLWQ